MSIKMTARQNVGKSRILQGLPCCAKGGTLHGVLISVCDAE